MGIKIESNVPIPVQLPTNVDVLVKRGRGGPKGSTNKPKEYSAPVGRIDSSQPNVANVPQKRAKWEQREPKAPKEPKGKGYTVVGSINKGLAAIEWEGTGLTKEQKEKNMEQEIETKWWRQMCRCTHSRIGHKTAGTGKCSFCDCEVFE